MSESVPIPPKSKGSPSAETVKAYWDAATKPSGKTIEAQMRAQGYDISARSVLRCVQNGFAPRAGAIKGGPTSTKTAKTSPEINAVRQVQAVAPGDASPELIAGALVEHLRSLPEGEVDRLKDLLGMDDAELDKQSGKLVKVARLLLAEGIAERPSMMLLMPDKTAKLLVVLDAAAPVAPPMQPSAGADAKVIEHNANEPRQLSASAQAIRDFRMKMGSAA